MKEWIIKNGAPASKVKAVCFTIVSHDQGGASEDDFPGAFDLLRHQSVGLKEDAGQENIRDRGRGLKQPSFEISGM